MFTHTLGNEQNHITAKYDGKTLFDFDYPKHEYIDFDPWSAEEFIDFFLRLTNISRDQEFIQFWTCDPMSSDE